MANVRSIGGNPIVLGLDGLTDDAKQALGSSVVAGGAEALIGAASTAQWAQRTTEGSGAATVRSVQGAAVVWNQLYSATSTSNTVDGITRTTNSDGSVTVDGTATSSGYLGLTGVTVTAGHRYLYKGCPAGGSEQTYRFAFAGTYLDYGNGYIVTAASTSTQYFRFYINAGVTFSSKTVYPQLFDLTAMFGSGNEPSSVAEFETMCPASYYLYSTPTLKPVRIAGIASTTAQGGELDSIEWPAQTLRAAGSVRDELTADELVTRVGSRAYQSGDESDSSVVTDGTTTFYPLTTPITTPISPSLPMSYKVEQGGTESIIVPGGEISAAPIITVAEGRSAATVVMDALAAIAAPDGPIATANHALGTYLTMGGKLYKVTSAIAVGETIASGTNVTETTVMAELLALAN